MALKWEAEGAKALHVVDLDGAFKGNGMNIEIIRKMCEALTIPIEVGGGIRTEKAVKDYLDMGVYRVIIGSKAVASPYFAIQAAKNYGPDHIAVSVDAKGDEVATHGWVDGSSRKVMTFVETLLTHGVNTIIYTDISRDGMLTGPNFDMMKNSRPWKASASSPPAASPAPKTSGNFRPWASMEPSLAKPSMRQK